jgi:tetratricopeptide (TPR) repeat protein
MSIVTLLLPLLAQVGPGGALPQAPLPSPGHKEPARVSQPVASTPAPQSTQLQNCLKLAMTNPSDGMDEADGWLAAAKTMSDRAGAKQCKAMALTRLESWTEAAALFLGARDDTPANEPGERARLGALAGNALLVAGNTTAGLDALDHAHGEAHNANDHKLNGVIQIDRARALVALGRTAEASAALEEARYELPENSQTWLLSATLSRRTGKLTDAQHQIERAAALMPVDPEIGLEAGVIAVLSGRDEAARLSWQSVIKAAPGTQFAKTAQGYLDQLGPPRASPAK